MNEARREITIVLFHYYCIVSIINLPIEKSWNKYVIYIERTDVHGYVSHDELL